MSNVNPTIFSIGVCKQFKTECGKQPMYETVHTNVNSCMPDRQTDTDRQTDGQC